MSGTFDVSRDEILRGSIPRVVLVLSIPLVVQNLFAIAQLVVDLFWLGRYSSESVAAVGLVTPVFNILIAAVLFTPFVGTQILVSQRYGEEDDYGAKLAAFNGIVLALGLGLLGGLVGYFGAPTMIGFVDSLHPGDTDTEVFPLAIAYLQLLSLGLFLGAVSDVSEAAFIGRGDVRASLYLNVVAVSVNLTLDPFLIFGLGPFPELGIEGAALASICGYGSGVLLAVFFVSRGRAGGIVSTGAARLERETLAAVADIGFPTAVQNAGQKTVHLVLIVLVFASGGAAAVLAYTVGGRIASLASVPANGIQNATQSIVGQNAGASNEKRVDLTTLTAAAFGVTILAVAAFVQFVAAESIVTFFVPKATGEERALAVDYLRILAISYPAIGAIYMFRAGFNGLGQTRISLGSSLLEYWITRLPLAGIGVFYVGMGPHAVFWAVTISTVVAAIATATYYGYRRWRMYASRESDATPA